MQTWAIFLDAYRALNAKKMFWFVLIITLLVAGSFSLVGINEQGGKFGPWQGDFPMFNSTIISPALFYKGLFLNFGISFWLSWIGRRPQLGVGGVSRSSVGSHCWYQDSVSFITMSNPSPM